MVIDTSGRNHDTATYGMTEYEYYVNKGLLKGQPILV